MFDATQMLNMGPAFRSPHAMRASLAERPCLNFFLEDWLVVSTPLKNISQIGSFPQVGVKMKNI